MQGADTHPIPEAGDGQQRIKSRTDIFIAIGRELFESLSLVWAKPRHPPVHEPGTALILVLTDLPVDFAIARLPFIRILVRERRPQLGADICRG